MHKMNRTLLYGTAVMALAFGSAAWAQTSYQQQQRDYQQELQHHQQQQRDYRQAQRQWARGQRLPWAYRNHAHMVRDYGQRGWARPPRGYAYYTTDNGDVVMAAMRSGWIRSVIAGHQDGRRDEHHWNDHQWNDRHGTGDEGDGARQPYSHR